MAIMKANDFATRCKYVADNYKTLYVMGCFGWPMYDTMKARAKREHAYNARADRSAMIDNASSDTFGFDCVCFIKAILWVGAVTKTDPMAEQYTKATV